MTAFGGDFTRVNGGIRELTLVVSLPILERRLRFEGSAGERRTIPGRWTRRSADGRDVSVLSEASDARYLCSQGRGMGCIPE